MISTPIILCNRMHGPPEQVGAAEGIGNENSVSQDRALANYK